MLPKLIVELYRVALTTPYEKFEFASNMGLSSIWSEHPELPLSVDKKYILCSKVYDLAWVKITKLYPFSKMSRARMSRTFLIPEWTIEKWENSIEVPPDYIKLLLAESAGYFSEFTENI